MKNFTILRVLLFGLPLLLFSFEVPSGWFKAGSRSDSYEMTLEKGAGMDGKNAATIRSVDKVIDGYGTLMQSSSSEKFKGKRIRLSGYIKTTGVTEKAGFWLRIGQANSESFLAFDNMMDRPVTGTTDWQKYSIVLDVSEKASKISYGALLRGTGQIWFDKLTFEVVDASVPVTGKKIVKPKVVSEPLNLDFEN
ncbi:hypothetical protein [Flavobacterium pedocola]